MSELMNLADSGPYVRFKLLASVSALALSVAICAEHAQARDEDAPTVWMELGGQLDRMDGTGQPYLPPFVEFAIQQGLISPASQQAPTKYSIGEFGKITFQPEGSSWSFSGALRYGRSNKDNYAHQELEVPGVVITSNTIFQPPGPNSNMENAKTADYTVRSEESHAIIDFDVGKDVGVGLLSHQSNSQFNFGIRFAQFSSRTGMRLQADPDPHWGGTKYVPLLHGSMPIVGYYQFYKGAPVVNRNFRGIGPSVAWNESVPLLGERDEDAELAFDWGANFSVLFGRQKVRIDHRTTGDRYVHRIVGNPKYEDDHYVNDSVMERSHSVVVPNVGALAGLSLKFPSVKLSMGYRADLFFGAMDGGIDARQTYNRSFHGPFATISIGLGG